MPDTGCPWTGVPCLALVCPRLAPPLAPALAPRGSPLPYPHAPVGIEVTCRKSLCFLCPNPYPFPTGFSENTRVYTLGFGTIAAEMLRINPDPKKNARDIFWGRSGYHLGFIRGPLGISLGIYPVAAREIAWVFSGGRS